MSPRVSPAWPGRFVIAASALLLALIVPWQPVQAAPNTEKDPPKTDLFLKNAPADASFYWSMMRNRQQYEAIVKSNAWKKLTEMKSVTQAMATFQLYWGLVIQPQLQDEDNQELADLLLDMVSDEIAVYGGSTLPDLLELYNKMTVTAQMQAILAKGTGKDPEEMTTKAMMTLLEKNADKIKVPDMVMAFKLSKPERVEKQLKRLEDALKESFDNEENAEDLKGRLKREKIGQDEFLTFTIDSKMVPLDNLPMGNDDYKKAIKKIKDLKGTISIGVRNKYLLVAISESTELIANLGKGKKLIDTEEFKPFQKFADRPVTSVAYSSKKMGEQTGVRVQGDHLTKEVLEGLEAVKGNNDEEKKMLDRLRDQVKKDLPEAIKDLEAINPKPGPSLSFSFLTDRGWESYSHDYRQQLRLDGSKPLSLLEHTGGNPICAVVARGKSGNDDWAKLVKWVKKGTWYFEEFGLPQLQEEDRMKYVVVKKLFLPMIAKLEETTAKQIIPALADSQTALVVDGKLSSKEWHKEMPKADRDLPIFEPALVVGVTDPVKLKKGFGEYRETTNELLAQLRELAPKQVPELKIPEPKTKELKKGTLYYYALPAEFGLDKQLSPNAGLGEKVAVMSISTGHTERLLTATPFKVDSTPLANTKRNLSAAVWFNFHGFLDVVQPWTEYGITEAAKKFPIGLEIEVDDGNEKQQAKGGVEDVLKDVKSLFQILRVFRSHSSATYTEGGATVTHGETVIKDIQ